jgi:hypothetical protein
VDGYKRIHELEHNLAEMRLTIISIYKHLTEESGLVSKVRALKEKSSVEDVQKKEVEELIAKARRIK